MDSFPCFIVLTRTSNKILNKYGESSCLVSDFSRKLLGILPLRMMPIIS